MKVVSIDEIEIGDKVVVQESDTTVQVMTVMDYFVSDGLIVFKETCPLDYAPNEEQIIVLDDDY